MYPLSMIVGNSDQENILLQEYRAPGGYVVLLRETVMAAGRMAVVPRIASVAEIRAVISRPMTKRTITSSLYHVQLQARRSIPIISMTPNPCGWQRQGY
ncbi:hypothetical protein TNCV_4093131 [Trichonephila clavipes]|nr:hypothetical protein TNCV_4093131 [Trichonephila clavipes]